MSEDTEPAAAERAYHAVVIGSGFAGAVTACRLSEVGVSVLVLERGRRYQPDDLPVYPKSESTEGGRGDGGEPLASRDLSRAFWKLGHGLWDLRDLGDVVVAQAAGLGGGSLIYANVHLRAPAEVFDEHWPAPYRRTNLDDYYDLAAFMLEVEPLPQTVAPGKTWQLDYAAKKLGRTAFRPPLAVNFTKLKNRFEVPQSPCDLRGECCFGCSQSAKNSLDLNYLELAARAGAGVETLAEVVAIERSRDDGRYTVHYQSHLDGKIHRETAQWVFLCAGAVNSTELLLKSRAAGYLPSAIPEPGRRYFANADTLAVCFDCDDLHEADRGPTITSTLCYDAAPDDSDPLARWTLCFQEGGEEPVSGRAVSGAKSRAKGVLARPPILSSGSWGEGTAAGELVLSELSGTFLSGEDLVIEQAPFARASAAARKSSHWILIQDGGIPEPLEPLLGVFRSPLWLRRNRFREADGIASAGRPSRPSYAELPFGSLADLASGLPSGAWKTAPALRNRIRRWLPLQLAEALERDRVELLDDFAASAEPLVSRFLDGVAEQGNADSTLERLLVELAHFGFDASGIAEQRLGRQVLNLGIQLAVGSEAMLVKAVVRMLMDRAIPESGEITISRRLFEILRWALDCRLSDGRNAVLLAMGRDSLPGELALATGGAPQPGSVITGAQSGAAGILVTASATAGSWMLGDASGTLLLAELRGRFRKDEPLRGAGAFSVALADPEDLSINEPSAALSLDPSFATAVRYARLCSLRFGPVRSSLNYDERRQRDLERVAAAPLSARLAHPFDASERATQERLLRDIAAVWGGELRTNPSWSFLGKQVTVHSQGGCAMGARPGESVTEANGEVVNCPGLYVMDAAAFPTSVGVNPSATIAAVAELKVEQFIRREIRSDWRATHFEEARRWASTRRSMLDPLAGRSSSAPPQSQPIGIEFDEEMRGELHDGSNGKLPITAALHATIHDLARFLEYDRRGDPQRIEVSGHVEIGYPSRTLTLHVIAGSFMRLFRKVSDQGEAEYRAMEYVLELGPLCRASAPSHRLEGEKKLRDEQGFDVWEDSSTLPFTLFADGATPLDGTLRLPPEVFFDKQLPSFRVTGTEDRARQSWALVAFGKFFLGHLVDVYVPELDRVIDAVKILVERSRD